MPRVVYLVQDLLFTSKIREIAGQLGVEAARARTPEELCKAAPGAQLVVLDLRLPDAARALELLKADPAASQVPSVGFVDHEREDVMAHAAERGCRTVLAKGAFSARLAQLLAFPS